MRRACLFFILISLVLPAGSLMADVVTPLKSLTGMPVVSLLSEGAEIPTEEFLALLSIGIGDPLVPERVRESVVNLYRTGRFESVTVLAREVQGGVQILFRVAHKRWLEEIRFEGNLSVPDSDLIRKILLRRGEEIVLEDFETSRQNLREYYRYRGYYSVQIAYRTETDRMHRTSVVFQVTEGPHSIVRQIELAGDLQISRFRFLNLLSTRLGGTLNGSRVDKDIKRITSYLKKQGYYFPDVSYSAEDLQRELTGVKLIYSVTTGPRYSVRVRTSEGINTKKFLKWIKEIFLNARGQDDAMDDSYKKIREYILGIGYPFVFLQWSREEEGTTEVKLTLDIDRGWHSTVGEISVLGVEALSGEDVSAALGVSMGDPFVRSILDSGLESLAGSYTNRGYLSARISLEALRFLPEGQERKVPLSITVSEGVQTLIGDIQVEGGVYSASLVKQIMGMREGAPYVPEELVRGREALLNRLSGDGYLYGSVVMNEPITNGHRSVDIRVQITEGARVLLGSIVITGNEEVKSKIIRLALDLQRGQVLTLEKILEAQERIYRLGVMNSVEIRLAEPEVEAQVKDLIVKVKERKRYVVGLKIGYGNEDLLRSEVSLTNRNFANMARSIRLRLRGSSRESLTSLTYHQPWFLDRNIEFSASISDLLEERESYTRDTEVISVDLKREISRKTSARLEYSFEGLQLSNVSAGAVLSPEDVGKTDVAAIIPEVIYDSRDDFFEPARGVVSNIRLEVASKILVSKAEFYKIEAGTRRYISLSDNMVLAAILRLGLVKSYGQSEEVLISKRFFLGGQNSVRGYSLDSLGPRDSAGDPIGGNYMINFNAELRYPLYRSIKSVFFVDSGSLWLDQKPYNDKTLRVSTGLGLRWSSPIGPLSLDYGYKLNPAVSDEDISRIHFSIGHAF